MSMEDCYLIPQHPCCTEFVQGVLMGEGHCKGTTVEIHPLLPTTYHISYSQYMSQMINEHGFLTTHYTRDFAKLQEGLRCPLLTLPW